MELVGEFMFNRLVDAWPIILTICACILGYSKLESRVLSVEKDVVRVETQATASQAPITAALFDISNKLNDMNINLTQRLSKIEGAMEYKKSITR